MNPQLWVRIRERAMRFHAVYCEAYGVYWLYCGRTIRIGSEEQWICAAPPAVCGCCASRVKLPFNVPAKLQQLAAREVIHA